MFARLRESYFFDVFFFICFAVLSAAVVLGATWAIYRYPGTPAEAVQARFPEDTIVTYYRKPGDTLDTKKYIGLFLVEKQDGSQVLAVVKPHSVLPTCKVEIRGRIDDPAARERVTMKIKSSHFKSDSVTVVNGETLEVENPVFGYMLRMKEYISMVSVIGMALTVAGYAAVHEMKQRWG